MEQGESASSERRHLSADNTRPRYYGSTPSSNDKMVDLAEDLAGEVRKKNDGYQESGNLSSTPDSSTYRKITNSNVYIPPTKRTCMMTLRSLAKNLFQFNFKSTSPHSNVIHTTKYTLLTFIPKNLFEQFHRFANLYFLLIIILNFIPAIEAFGKEVSWIPLTCVLLVTAIKDAIEDIRRYQSDKEINARLCEVFNRFVILINACHLHV